MAGEGKAGQERWLAVVDRGCRLGRGLDFILSVMGREAVLAERRVLG